MKMKKNYVRPLTAVTRVELESPICGGSVEITNPNEEIGRIDMQQTNTAFDAGSQTTGGNNANGWDFSSSTPQSL